MLTQAATAATAIPKQRNRVIVIPLKVVLVRWIRHVVRDGLPPYKLSFARACGRDFDLFCLMDSVPLLLGRGSLAAAKGLCAGAVCSIGGGRGARVDWAV